MLTGLTSPSQSLSTIQRTRKRRLEKRREEGRETEAQSRRGGQNREVRVALRGGGGMRVEVERVKHQMSVSGITRVPNMQEAFWQVSLTYIVRKLENCSLKQVFQLLNETQ